MTVDLESACRRLEEAAERVEAAIRRHGQSSPWMDEAQAAEYLRFDNIKTFRNKTLPSSSNPIPSHRGPSGTGEKRFHRDELDAWQRGELDR